MSSKQVRSITVGQRTFKIGDHFALKDVDGGSPTGDYVIDDIRVDTHYTISFRTGNPLPFDRVYLGSEGQYTNVVNVVNVAKESAIDEYTCIKE